MKVICDRGALVDVVNNVTSVVASRTPSPVLQCVKLTAADGVLALAATDLEVALRACVEAVEVESDGEVLIPADKLAQIVRNSADTTLTIESDDHTVHIRGEDSHFTIFGYDPKEAPPGRPFDNSRLDCELDGSTFHRLISRTLFAAAAEHSRYAINGILFDREGRQIRMVATDGRRLALARGRCEASDGKATCIIPAKALSLLNKLARDPDTKISIALEENQAVFRIGESEHAAVLATNLVEGTFPPFEDVIPKDQDKKVTFDVEILRSAIRRAALLTNEESKGVRMSFTGEGLTLTSRAPEMGEAEIHVDLDAYEGDPVEIGFNPGFITDALKVIDAGEVLIELKAANKPGVLKTGSEFTYVVMPVNLA
ncbi:MAG: DNA polymerase III subunit beta [Phycisphaerales bacterium]|nr:DNA polymerase III subunit beta [Phycisphaerae bacterium]NNF42202.1 DNA polymerase III subunit beta [Phycisphaerales bacterium]NNM24788.1 DNA polymerase III subunit beta [Phycisphaerales bacterium]